MNIMCKVYERVKKLQNENKQENISSMQTAGKKNRSTISNHNQCNKRKTNSRQ